MKPILLSETDTRVEYLTQELDCVRVQRNAYGVGFALMALIAILAVLLLSGCSPRPDVVSSRGVSSYFNGIDTIGLDKTEADSLESRLLEGLRPWGYNPGFLTPYMSYVKVEWHPKAWKTLVQIDGGIADTLVDGTEVGEDIDVANAPENCPGRSAYQHELLHYFQLLEFNVIDSDHKRPEWQVLSAVELPCLTSELGQ